MERKELELQGMPFRVCLRHGSLRAFHLTQALVSRLGVWDDIVRIGDVDDLCMSWNWTKTWNKAHASERPAHLTSRSHVILAQLPRVSW